MSSDQAITVMVCADCGSDVCAGGYSRYCLRPLDVPKRTAQAPACRHVDDVTGRQCFRPERVHTSGWTHAFVGESDRECGAPMRSAWRCVKKSGHGGAHAYEATIPEAWDPSFATARQAAHALLDELINDETGICAPPGTMFASDDGRWMRRSLYLRAAVRDAAAELIARQREGNADGSGSARPLKFGGKAE